MSDKPRAKFYYPNDAFSVAAAKRDLAAIINELARDDDTSYLHYAMPDKSRVEVHKSNYGVVIVWTKASVVKGRRGMTIGNALHVTICQDVINTLIQES